MLDICSKPLTQQTIALLTVRQKLLVFTFLQLQEPLDDLEHLVWLEPRESVESLAAMEPLDLLAKMETEVPLDPLDDLELEFLEPREKLADLVSTDKREIRVFLDVLDLLYVNEQF